jgi:hypothetical protein
VRLDTAKSARFSGSVPSTHRFAASMRAAGTIYPPVRNAILGRENAGIRRMSAKCGLDPDHEVPKLIN